MSISEAFNILTIDIIFEFVSILFKSVLVKPGNILLKTLRSVILERFWFAKTVLLYDFNYSK